MLGANERLNIAGIGANGQAKSDLKNLTHENIIAIHKALRELSQLGWITGDLPRLVAVQAAGCAPIVAAFAALYILWGSTYLAVAEALRTIPPFLLMGTRSVAGGAAGSPRSARPRLGSARNAPARIAR